MSNICFKMPICVLVLLVRENALVLIHRKATGWLDNLWALPGGRVDGNESLTDATAREAYEELGVTLDKNNLRFVHLGHIKRPDLEYLMVVFVCTKWEGEPYNKEEHKHTAVQWFDLEQLPAGLTSYALYVIEAYKNNRVYNEYEY